MNKDIFEIAGEKTPNTREYMKTLEEVWGQLPPVYFAKWMWELACKREPHKYSMKFPVYQEQRVILT